MAQAPRPAFAESTPCRRQLYFWCAAICVALLFYAGDRANAAGETLRRVLALPQTALLAAVADGAPIEHNADRAMIPASTMKLLTSLAAIEHWGLAHRFATDLYLGPDGWLWVKGAGDPFLVSEDLDGLVLQLRPLVPPTLAGIAVDDRLYAADLRIPGRARSSNPYDAPVTPLAVNFNTLHLQVEAGRVRSAEQQTPLTPVAQQLGTRLGPGSHRISLPGRELAQRYAGELVAAKLRAAGIAVGGGHRIGALPDEAQLLLRYRNGRDLGTVVAAMLKHSNNLIANQLFLLLAPASAERGRDLLGAQRAMTAWAERRFRWRDFRIEDGAGLSRGNRLSARQLVEVVEAFAPYRGLLPVQAGNPSVRAKTGTLSGVSAYAGFVRREGHWMPFAFLANQRISPGTRLRLANDLARFDGLGGP